MEKWQWEAHYLDGSILLQYDPKYHYSTEIDQSKLKSFWLVSAIHPPIIIDWKEGRELILFTDNIIECSDTTTKTTCIYCVGYKEQESQNLLVILPNNSIVFTDDIDKLNLTELIQ